MQSPTSTISSKIKQKDLTAIRSGLRQAFIRSKYKSEYLDKFKQTIPRYTKSGKLHKTPWVKYQCEECKELFKSDEINVDHIDKIGSFKTAEDIREFFFRIWCSYDNLQVLCVQCHDDKTAEEKRQKKAAKLRGVKADVVVKDEIKAKWDAEISQDRAELITASEIERRMKIKGQLIQEAAQKTMQPLIDATLKKLSKNGKITKEEATKLIEDEPNMDIENMTPKEIVAAAVTRSNVTFLGLPVFHFKYLSDNEFTVSGKAHGSSQANCLVTESDVTKMEMQIQREIHKRVKEGMIVTHIKAGKPEILLEAATKTPVLVDRKEEQVYPEETISSLDDLI